MADFLLNKNCESLETLNLPVSLQRIGLDAFGGGERITARYAGTEVQWASVNRNGWEPYAVVFGAAQPALSGSLSAGSLAGRSVTDFIKSILMDDGEEKMIKETTEGEEEPDMLEETQAATPSSVRMTPREENDDGG